MCEEEARIVQMRPVEKAAPGLSGPVGGSVSYVLGLDDVVLGDGGVSSGAVSEGLRDLDRVSRSGDAVVSGFDEPVCGVNSVMSADVLILWGIDTVVSGVDESVCGVNSVMSADVLNLCGIDTVVSGVDEPVCGVNSVMSADVLNLCGIDTVVSDVDDPVCCGSSVMTDGELDVCGCDCLVSDEAGDSSGVEVVVSVDDVVACGDDPLLPEGIPVGGRLSVVGDTLVCDSGVTRSGKRDTGVVVGPGVVQPGWVDGFICIDGSQRHEPPPMHAMCLRHMLLAAAC